MKNCAKNNVVLICFVSHIILKSLPSRESVRLFQNIYSLDTRSFVGMQLWCAKGRSVCMIVYVCMLGCVGFIRSLKAFATWKYYIVILLRVCMDILYKDGSSFYMFNGQNGGEYWQVSHTHEEENKMTLFHSTSCYVLSIVIKHFTFTTEYKKGKLGCLFFQHKTILYSISIFF